MQWLITPTAAAPVPDLFNSTQYPFTWPPRDGFPNVHAPLINDAMASTAQSIIDDRRSRQRKAARACELDGIWNASRALEDPPLNVARGFTYPPASKQPKFFVKYTDSESKSLLEHERRNQEFAYNTLRTLQQTASPQRKLLVLAPEIFRAFEHRGYYFLVMEFVPGKTMEGLFREETHETSQGSRATLYRHVADAIRLLSVKAPPGSKPGPVGGGILRHPIFSDFQAVVPYRDVKMLETHLNNVSSTSSPQKF